VSAAITNSRPNGANTTYRSGDPTIRNIHASITTRSATHTPKAIPAALVSLVVVPANRSSPTPTSVAASGSANIRLMRTNEAAISPLESPPVKIRLQPFHESRALS
jgi:hypothetical protein